jgi:hypothetical protein
MKALLGKAQEPGFWAQVRESEVYRPLREGLLDKWEKEFVREHKALVTLKVRMSEEDRRKEDEDAAFLKELIGG